MTAEKKYIRNITAAICTLWLFLFSAVTSGADTKTAGALAEAQAVYLRISVQAYTSAFTLTDAQQKQIRNAFDDYLKKDLLPVLTKLHLQEKWADLQRDTQFQELHRELAAQPKRKEKIAILQELRKLQKDYYPELDQVVSDPVLKKATLALQRKLNGIVKKIIEKHL